jgi:hypothetical protein
MIKQHIDAYRVMCHSQAYLHDVRAATLSYRDIATTLISSSALQAAPQEYYYWQIKRGLSDKINRERHE